MRSQLRPALVLLLGFTILTGVIYPLLVTGLARSIFPHQAGGSLVRGVDGELVGSALIGQRFSSPRYFVGRPSATAAAPYDAAAAAASNLGPSNPALHAAVRDRISTLRSSDPQQTPIIPADLVTASASGLDPHISPEAARFQAPRVAAARDLPLAEVLAQIDAHTEPRTLGVLGEPRVHVLSLNQDLDAPRR